MTSKLLVGQYVRCPIYFEDADKENPRQFILAKVKLINELSDVVTVDIFDMHHLRQYYEHIFKQKDFSIAQGQHWVRRCRACRGASVIVSGLVGGSCDGTILEYAGENEEGFFRYYVRLSEGQVVKVAESRLKIDCLRAEISPLVQLKTYELQNPSWYAMRRPVSRMMHEISNMSYGFDVLTSCRTFMLPHQISSVIQMFETRPVRYMLADEVGLGKTIEACSVIKILESENKELRVLYILPRALISQWKSELLRKFHIQAQLSGSEVENRHVIVAMEELPEHADLVEESWDCIVVDETHHLLSSDMRVAYDLVMELSEQGDNLLLLSATPIQDRAEEYLRLLRFLQPDHYKDITVDQFGEMVASQKVIQQTVNAIWSYLGEFEDYQEDIEEDFDDLTDTLTELYHDDNITHLREQAREAPGEKKQELYQKAIAYISENYQLERRVIRNRREYIYEVAMGHRCLQEFPYQQKNVLEGYGEQNVYDVLTDFLQGQSALYTAEGRKNFFYSLARPLLTAMFSSPWALLSEIERLKVRAPELLENVKNWCRQADEEIRRMDELLDDPDRIGNRMLRAVDYLEQEIDINAEVKDNNGKVVVFTAYKETLERFSEMLEKRNIKHVLFAAGMNREQLDDSVDLFQSCPDIRLLICDETGGEGRNFQNADYVIHLDLPWTVNTLEQRIGRLDRMNRDKGHPDIHSVVFYAEDTIEEQLFTIWNKGMSVFENSLSGLEIMTAELNEKIEEAVTEDIAEGLGKALEDIQATVDDCRMAVEDQHDYDAAGQIYNTLRNSVEDMLEKFQSEESERHFERALRTWGTQSGLQFVTEPENENILKCTEKRFSLRSAMQAILPPPEWEQYNGTSIVRREGEIKGTFNRGYAVKREDLIFFAPGDTVFDCIIGNALDSARGRCCAIGFRGETEFTGFVFSFNVGPDTALMLEKNIPSQLMSQFRMYFPLQQITVGVALDHTILPQERLESLLTPWNLRKADHLGRRGRDTLRGVSPLKQFKQQYPRAEWHIMIQQAFDIASKEAMKQYGKNAELSAADEEMKRVLYGHISEYRYLHKDEEELKGLKEQYGIVKKAMHKVKLQLDSACFMVVTG